MLVTLAEHERPRFGLRAALRAPGTSYPEVPYTHEHLAEMAGTHRETATKVLNELRVQG